MTIPFPYEATAGSLVDPAEQEALNLRANLIWLARLIDEIDAEPELNRKKLVQLMFHSQKYRLWYEAMQARGASALDVLQGVLLVKKMIWITRSVMVQDLGDLYADTATIIAWVKANITDWATASQADVVPVTDANGNITGYIDVAKTMQKPVSLGTRISALRARFGPK